MRRWRGRCSSGKGSKAPVLALHKRGHEDIGAMLRHHAELAEQGTYRQVFLVLDLGGRVSFDDAGVCSRYTEQLGFLVLAQADLLDRMRARG